MTRFSPEALRAEAMRLEGLIVEHPTVTTDWPKYVAALRALAYVTERHASLYKDPQAWTPRDATEEATLYCTLREAYPDAPKAEAPPVEKREPPRVPNPPHSTTLIVGESVRGMTLSRETGEKIRSGFAAMSLFMTAHGRGDADRALTGHVNDAAVALRADLARGEG